MCVGGGAPWLNFCYDLLQLVDILAGDDILLQMNAMALLVPVATTSAGVSVLLAAGGCAQPHSPSAGELQT